MNPDESTSPQTGTRRRRTWAAWTAGALVCAIAGLAVALRSAPAAAPAVPVVQGELINPPPQTKAPTAIAAATPASPSPAPAMPAASPGATQSAKSGDYVLVGFDKLAGFPLRLHWVMVDPVRIKGVQKMMDPVPADIKALDDSKIAVRGFMLPLKLEDGKVTEFFLLRTQARCCYGLPIQMNEVLTVQMAKPGVKSIMDQPITIYGRLHVIESHDDSGALTSIYTMDGDKMDTPTAL